MPKVILFNAPANTGKSVATDHLLSIYKAVTAPCKEELWHITMVFFNLSEGEFFSIYEDREQKETPREEFAVTHAAFLKLVNYLKDKEMLHRMGDSERVGYTRLSCREALIFVSETIVKPTLGGDVFGRYRASFIKGNDMIYIDDSAGFEEELHPLIDIVGKENILLVRVHREGCSFDGDSRNYVPESMFDYVVDIDNSGSLEEFLNDVAMAVKGWLGDQEGEYLKYG